MRCLDCGGLVSRKHFKRCRSCNDKFQVGKNSPRFVHGYSPKEKKQRFYITWRNIVRRCTRKYATDYNRYGGRGIKVEWQSFQEFLTDMHESYLAHVREFGEKDTTIDRIDSNGNYCKKNCRWATIKEQSRNKRKTKKITFNGITKTLVEWAEEYGVSHKIVRQRIARDGWSFEEAIGIS